MDSRFCRLFSLVLAAACAWSAASCTRAPIGAAAAEPIVQDLLTRLPGEVLDQPGVLEPSAEEQWGPYQLGGWAAYTAKTPQGRHAVATDQRAAELLLPVRHLRDRTLMIEMWAPTGPDGSTSEQEVTLLLNGHAIGTQRITNVIAPHSVEAPKALWHEGKNLLRFEVPELKRGITSEPIGLTVARVEYGRQRFVLADPVAHTLTLQARTMALFRVEDARRLSLSIRAHSAAKDAALRVEFRRLDPSDGLAMPTGEPEVLAPENGALATAVPLPENPSGPVEIELSWMAPDDDGADLVFDELSLRGLSRAERPPIVFISLDTVSARHLSLYGYGRDTTPNLTAFAQQAVTFERCITNASWTLPSYLSVMTGLYPYSHALDVDWAVNQEPHLWEQWQLAESRWTLAEALRAAGYATGGFVDNLWLTPRFHFTQGFDSFDYSAGKLPLGQDEGGFEHTAALARRWLASVPQGKPPFLFLHAFDAHGPYLPPESTRGSFAGKAPRLPISEAYAGAIDCCYGGIHDYIAAPYAEEGGVPNRLRTDAFAEAYDECIAGLDRRLGALFDHLKQTGLFDRAIIVVSADHGESMVGHDFYFAHGALYDDILRVPLVIRLPGGANGGARVAQAVQLVDLYPTLLELAGIPAEREYLHGRSLVPLLRGQSLPATFVHSQAGLMRQACIEKDGWKLILMQPNENAQIATKMTFPGLPAEFRRAKLPELEASALTQAVYDRIRADSARWAELCDALYAQLDRPYAELYHVSADPDEREDLMEREPERANQLLEALLAELGRSNAAKAVVTHSSLAAESLTPDEIEDLRKLGYGGAR